VRLRVLRWFARSGLIEPEDVREMLAWENSGFSLDTAVCGHSMSGLSNIAADGSRTGDVSFFPTAVVRRPAREGRLPDPLRMSPA
jgi:hypothetical protein